METFSAVGMWYSENGSGSRMSMRRYSVSPRMIQSASSVAVT